MTPAMIALMKATGFSKKELRKALQDDIKDDSSKARALKDDLAIVTAAFLEAEDPTGMFSTVAEWLVEQFGKNSIGATVENPHGTFKVVVSKLDN